MGLFLQVCRNTCYLTPIRLFWCFMWENIVDCCINLVLNTMFLLLQKTNIIRDYLEDLVEGRAFWVRCPQPRLEVLCCQQLSEKG